MTASAKPPKTLLPIAHTLYVDQKPASKPEKQELKSISFREVRRLLLYTSILTLPDTAAAVCMPGRLHSNPSLYYWKMLKHFERYLVDINDFVILLKQSWISAAMKAWSGAE